MAFVRVLCVPPRFGVRLSSSLSILDAEKSHAQKLHPGAFDLLQNTYFKTRNAPKTKLWNKLQKYKQHFKEKSILLDDDIASSIASCITETTEGDPSKTLFIDGDGGLCGVSKHLLSRGTFHRAKVSLKDPAMRALQDWAVETELGPFRDRVTQQDFHVNTMPADMFNRGGSVVTPLRKEIEGLEGPPPRDAPPPYTLFASGTRPLIYYLSHRLLNSQNPASEFHGGHRPEFYIALDYFSHVHISNPTGSLIYRKGPQVLVSLCFDFELLTTLSKQGFFPWRRQSTKNSDENQLYLYRLRPKADMGLAQGATGEHLEFFVYSLLRSQKTVRLIPLLEQWVSGIGIDLIREGFTIYDTVAKVGKFQDSAVDNRELVRLLNVLVQHKNFNEKNFMERVRIFQQDLTRIDPDKMAPEIEQKLQKLRRDGSLKKKEKSKNA